jgi:hypothetical protein
MTAPTKNSLSAEVGRLALWVFGIGSFFMAIGIDDGLVRHILRVSTAIFCFGLLMSMTLKRLLPNWKMLFWTTLVVSVVGGFVAVGLKLYELIVH